MVLPDLTEWGSWRKTRIFTSRNEAVAKVMFLHMSVILFTGGVSRKNPPGTRENPLDQADPPRPGRHLQTRQNPPDQADTPPDQADTPPPRPGRQPPPTREKPPDQADTPHPGRRLQHTVNERPVRILLECILV